MSEAGPPVRAGAAAAGERPLHRRQAAGGRRRSRPPSPRPRRGSARSGRLVVRPSGTEPLIRVMAEGDDAALVRQVVDDIVGVIADTRNAA